MGKHKLVDLAELLETLALVPPEIAAAVVPEINDQILKMGKPDGPLRKGNRVKARVVAVGNQIRIVGVFPEAGIRRSWLNAVRKVALKVLAKHMQSR